MNSRYAREIDIPPEERSRGNLVRRDVLRRQAQTIMHVNDGRHHNKQHRVCWCGRHAVSEGPLPVLRRLDGAGARVGSVKTCGSVWACPVCAAKVAGQRQTELAYAMKKHTANGGHAYLLTFTFPHYRDQTLAELMEPFAKARNRFQSSKGWKKVMGAEGTAGRLGGVTSLEVTYGGANGWHPHLHMLVFCQPGAFAESEPDELGRLTSRAIDFFRDEWVRLLEKSGLVDASNREWASQYALDVRGGKGAAEYVAKWGLVEELTMSHAKTGKRHTFGTKDHYTPFQLLELSEHDMKNQGDGRAARVFHEFVTEFDGKRMLTWSPGLKKHFGIDEIEDEEAAAEQELKLNDEHAVGVIDQGQLTTLVSRGAYGRFLAFIAEFGHLDNPQQLIDDWIAAAHATGRQRKGNILVDRMVIGDHSYWHTAEEIEA
jgi:hypothetical protein